MWRQNFEEFIRFFQKGLNPFKIQGRFKIYFFPEFFNLQSCGILKLVQKVKFLLMFQAAYMQNHWNIEMKVTILNFKVRVSENH
jgi:hypothetical protein